ncbi:Pectate lyase [Quillaja saponaria]|uniref:Pectate lyase n=1 Tax=Quillaja saponaria TaxID=32244 RepID=A0AAD7PG61_QUISA|nr:Pectate lyase [Quillaja saponaria]
MHLGQEAAIHRIQKLFGNQSCPISLQMIQFCHFHKIGNPISQASILQDEITMQETPRNNNFRTQNWLVQEVHRKINGSRRNLGYLSCGSGNPIDDCWRRDGNWEENRQRLADCAIGFGKNAIGGRDGRTYVVTDSSDNDVVNPKSRTLRYGVIQDEPLWIIFAGDMVMPLGHSDSYTQDKNMQVIIAFNHFGEGLVQRMPRCRHGYFHVVNNDYTHREMYAIGASANPTINSQGNRFTAPDARFIKEVTKHEDAPESKWKNW